MTATLTRDPAAQVLQWILDGASERDIREAIAANFPQEDGEALIVTALRGLSRSAETWPGMALGWCFEASRDLYRRMVEIGDFPGALRAVKQIAELNKRTRPRPDKSQDEGGLAILDVG